MILAEHCSLKTQEKNIVFSKKFVDCHSRECVCWAHWRRRKRREEGARRRLCLAISHHPNRRPTSCGNPLIRKETPEPKKGPPGKVSPLEPKENKRIDTVFFFPQLLFLYLGLLARLAFGRYSFDLIPSAAPVAQKDERKKRSSQSFFRTEDRRETPSGGVSLFTQKGGRRPLAKGFFSPLAYTTSLPRNLTLSCQIT